MLAASLPIYGLWVAVGLLSIVWLLARRKPARVLPPGPRGLPLIGNLLDFPRTNQAYVFNEWTRAYGDVVHVNMFGRPMIVLGSYEAACDLLEKRSANYSDRPPLIMAQLASLTDWAMPVMGYGPRWKMHRRVFHRELLPDAVVKYQDVQLRTTWELLRNLLSDPDRFMDHITHAFLSTALGVGYGLDATGNGEQYASMLKECLEIGGDVFVPGKYLVELLPFLQHLPLWLPGAGFRRVAERSKHQTLKIIKSLYEAATANLRSGDETHDSILANIVQHEFQLQASVDESEQQRLELENLCAGVPAATYIAGADTTEATMQTFILAMMLYPDVQAKVRTELDAVVGPNRLPDFLDRDSLPYIDAIIKELVRWYVITSTGIPHSALEDDEYRGYFIPKGAVILSNTWAFARDPELYPDPDVFDPDRFIKNGKLNPAVRDPYRYIFGYGRRICPGRHLADASLFITCASLLHIFEILPPLDASGVPVIPEIRFDTHLVTAHPEPFECRIVPRSKEAAILVESTVS